MRSPSSQLMTVPDVAMLAFIDSYSTRFAPIFGSTAPSMSQMCAYLHQRIREGRAGFLTYFRASGKGTRRVGTVREGKLDEREGDVKGT